MVYSAQNQEFYVVESVIGVKVKTFVDRIDKTGNKNVVF